jgi:DNA repair protein RadC
MFQMQYGKSPAARRLVRELPYSERPLTRLSRVGAAAMSSAELLAVALATPDALDLAGDVLRMTGGVQNIPRLTAVELQQIDGVGESLAARIIALVELGRRSAFAQADERPLVSSPADAANLLMMEMSPLTQERLRVILLDTRNRVIGSPTIYIGSLNTAVMRIAEVFRPAIVAHAAAIIVAHAAAIIVAHNHPSGDPSPSPEDVNVTRQLVRVGSDMDVPVLDHVIIGHMRYVSLKERGLGFDV